MSIDNAIATRWNAKGLSSVITGGVYKTLAPERTQPPYCIYNCIGNPSIGNTVAAQLFEQTCSFKVYATLDTDAETFVRKVADAFRHADRAASNPLSANPEIINNVTIVENPVNDQETDNLYSSQITLKIAYSEPQSLTPP